ncbi:helix-turn-helix domain-containing protein [bacterium]|nr:helix-turn-helix domain-containing protein [bacterium]
MAPKSDKGEKALLTTFDAADYCYVTPNTIKNWIKTGQMKAYTTPGGHYRIRRRDLEEFVVKHSMATKGQERNRERPIVLVVDRDEDTLARIAKILEEEHVDLHMVRSSFEAGLKVAELRPDVVVQAAMPGDADIVRSLKNNSLTSATPVIALASEPSDVDRLTMAGANDSLVKPFKDRELLEKIHQALPRPVV